MTPALTKPSQTRDHPSWPAQGGGGRGGPGPSSRRGQAKGNCQPRALSLARISCRRRSWPAAQACAPCQHPAGPPALAVQEALRHCHLRPDSTVTTTPAWPRSADMCRGLHLGSRPRLACAFPSPGAFPCGARTVSGLSVFSEARPVGQCKRLSAHSWASQGTGVCVNPACVRTSLTQLFPPARTPAAHGRPARCVLPSLPPRPAQRTRSHTAGRASGHKATTHLLNAQRPSAPLLLEADNGCGRLAATHRLQNRERE